MLLNHETTLEYCGKRYSVAIYNLSEDTDLLRYFDAARAASMAVVDAQSIGAMFEVDGVLVRVSGPIEE